MSAMGRWEPVTLHVPLDTRTVRILATYKDDGYLNQDHEYIYFETDGHFKDDKWYISPPRFVCDTYQEAEEKLKVMFWQYKTPHPILKAEL